MGSGTFEAFQSRLVTWLQYVLDTGHRHAGCKPDKAGTFRCYLDGFFMSSEHWLKHSLDIDHTNVIKWDFHRTELRYERAGHLCVSPQYRACGGADLTARLHGATVNGPQLHVCGLI